jgi:uncharacterized protein YrrD
MLRSLSDILGYDILATDGEIGSTHDFYFDDESWTIRYVVANTGGWLKGRMVLLSPESFGEPDWETRLLPADLTRQQIEDSPPVDADRPVSRQQQVRLAAYFGWTPYWGAPGAPPEAYLPAEAEDADEESKADELAHGDKHLRSIKEVEGYRIDAHEDRVGHVEDFVVQTDEWAVRYLVVDTRNWLPGRKVLVSPAWVQSVDWVQGLIHVDLDAETIRNSPEFDHTQPINREYEARLYDYYGRPKYW